MNNYKGNNNKSAIKRNQQSNSTDDTKRRVRSHVTKFHETEEEAVIRRYHDAKRVARFRARRKNNVEKAKILEAGNITKLFANAEFERRNIMFKSIDSIACIPNMLQLGAHLFVQNCSIIAQPICSQSQYSELLAIIEELGKEIKLTYAGSKISAGRLKIGIIKAKMLIKKCLIEIEMKLQQ